MKIDLLIYAGMLTIDEGVGNRMRSVDDSALAAHSSALSVTMATANRNHKQTLWLRQLPRRGWHLSILGGLTVSNAR